jgi:hypothetical protein
MLTQCHTLLRLMRFTAAESGGTFGGGFEQSLFRVVKTQQARLENGAELSFKVLGAERPAVASAHRFVQAVHEGADSL